jgi:cytidylate kinase
MSTEDEYTPSSKIERAEAILKAAIYSWNLLDRENRASHRPPLFITVTKQLGVDAGSFSHRLAQRLGEIEVANWFAWDRELIEKVSAEHGIAKDVLERVEDRPFSWIDRLLQDFSFSDDTPEAIALRADKYVMVTIRALAEAGHAIIVGRGGVFVTEGIPGGIHLALVAPLENRIKYIVERDKLSPQRAAEYITESEHNREMLYRQFWPKKRISPETFTLTLNSARLCADEMEECVLAIIRKRESL